MWRYIHRRMIWLKGRICKRRSSMIHGLPANVINMLGWDIWWYCDGDYYTRVYGCSGFAFAIKNTVCYIHYSFCRDCDFHNGSIVNMSCIVLQWPCLRNHFMKRWKSYSTSSFVEWVAVQRWNHLISEYSCKIPFCAIILCCVISRLHTFGFDWRAEGLPMSSPFYCCNAQVLYILIYILNLNVNVCTDSWQPNRQHVITIDTKKRGYLPQSPFKITIYPWTEM